MGESEFACPVCGRRFTADASASGMQIECPGCCQVITVPQAPTSDSLKSSLTASQTDSQDKLARCRMFLGSFAHDIQNQLSLIDAVLSLLQSMFAPGTEVHKDAVAISNELAPLGELVKNLYRFRYESPPRVVPQTPFRTFLGEEDAGRLYKGCVTFLADEIIPLPAAINPRLNSLQKALVPDSKAHKFAAYIPSLLDRLVRDSLEFAGLAEPNLGLTAIPVLLSEVGNLLMPYLGTRGIGLDIKAQADLHIHADARQLKQVLNELSQNAVESIGQNGTITQRGHTGEIVLKGLPTQVVLLEVEDTGSGIPLEVQGRIFEPFFSTKPGRVGLGLTRSARIIENHGGILNFETQAAKGAIFRIALPAQAGP